MREIVFHYLGIDYYVGMGAYDENLPIMLPTGIVLIASGWFETFPPQPMDIREIKPEQGMRCILASGQPGHDPLYLSIPTAVKVGALTVDAELYEAQRLIGKLQENFAVGSQFWHKCETIDDKIHNALEILGL